MTGDYSAYYWNGEHIARALIALAGMAVFAVCFFRILRHVFSGVKERNGRCAFSLRRVFTYPVSRFFRRSTAGLFHTVLFVAFIVIYFSVFLDEISLPEGIGMGAANIFAVLSLTAALVFLSRRLVCRLYRFRSPDLGKWQKADGIIVLSLEIAICLTFLAGYSFGWTKTGGLHFILVWIFLGYLCFSKHLHIILAFPTVISSRFTDALHIKPIEGIRKEAEYSLGRSSSVPEAIEGTLGAARPYDLPRRTLLEAYACTQCGRCMMQCPVNQAGGVLSPRGVEIALRKSLYGGKNRELSLGISSDAVDSCTACGACQESCPIGIDPLSVIIPMRQYALMEQGTAPEPWLRLMDNLEKHGRMWPGISSEVLSAANWSSSKAEYTLLLGEYSATDPAARQTAEAFIRILDKAGVSYRILEADPWEAVRRMGNEYLYQVRALELIDRLQKEEVRKILTVDPHILNTLKNEYPDFGGRFEVFHHTEFILHLLEEGLLRPVSKGGEKIKAVYHDPCYLARGCRVVEAPRRLLERLGVETVEPERRGGQTFCCGGGGGQFFLPHDKVRVNRLRLEQLSRPGIPNILTGCPFCLTMLRDAATSAKDGRSIHIDDIASLADRLTQGTRL